MIAPPGRGSLIGLIEFGQPLMGGGLLAAFAITPALAYMAPATPRTGPPGDRWSTSTTLTGQAWWEVGGNEPGLDLAHGADQGCAMATDRRRHADRALGDVGRASGAFRFRLPRASDAGAARVVARIVPAGIARPGRLRVVAPQRAGLSATLHLPTAIVPVRAKPVGTQCRASWCATYLAVPL